MRAIDWEFFVGKTIMSPTLNPTGWSGNFEIFDDIQTNEAPIVLGDHFRIYADSAPTSYQSQTVAGFDMFFEDATGKLLQSDTLPFLPPNLRRLNYGEGGWADEFQLTYAAEFRVIGVDGSAIGVGEIQSATAVPEPSSMLLLSIGGVALASVRRRLSRRT
jgi:hypothetical protein